MQTTEEHSVLSLDLPRAETYAYRKHNYGGVGVTRQPEGSSVSWGNLESPDSTLLEETETRPSHLYVSPEGFSWGSYVGATYTRSNYNVFLDRHGDKDGIFTTYGSHGSHGILVRGDVTDEHVLEDLQAVSDYPVLDTGDMSALELALENYALGLTPNYDDREGIGGYQGRALSAFREALEMEVIDRFEDERHLRKRAKLSMDLPANTAADDVIGEVLDLLDEFPEDELRSLFWDHAQRGHDVIHETATGPYVDAAAVADRVDVSLLLPHGLPSVPTPNDLELVSPPRGNGAVPPPRADRLH